MRWAGLLYRRCSSDGLPPIEARCRAVCESHCVPDPKLDEHRIHHFKRVTLVVRVRHLFRLELELCGELRVGHGDSPELRVGHADSLILGKLGYPYGHGDSLELRNGHADSLELRKGHADSLELRNGHADSLVIVGRHRFGCHPCPDLDRPRQQP